MGFGGQDLRSSSKNRYSSPTGGYSEGLGCQWPIGSFIIDARSRIHDIIPFRVCENHTSPNIIPVSMSFSSFFPTLIFCYRVILKGLFEPGRSWELRREFQGYIYIYTYWGLLG